MTELTEIHERLGWRRFSQGQFQHLLLALVLVPGALCLVEPHLTGQRIGLLSDREAA